VANRGRRGGACCASCASTWGTARGIALWPVGQRGNPLRRSDATSRAQLARTPGSNSPLASTGMLSMDSLPDVLEPCLRCPPSREPRPTTARAAPLCTVFACTPCAREDLSSRDGLGAAVTLNLWSRPTRHCARFAAHHCQAASGGHHARHRGPSSGPRHGNPLVLAGPGVLSWPNQVSPAALT
jgi:hypothetical protein